ncbi:hypothetical protein CHISP_0595 [Chitinispirillum alkaliphilum]|nr:hypothetical protein CHISP_0595 [Chitinispirillum alkaliphilum]
MNKKKDEQEEKMSLLDANTLELHYSFDNDSYTMDAFVQNRCEYEFLGVLKEVASVLGSRISIETESATDSGVRRWFKIDGKNKSDIASVTRTCIAALATGIFITSITKDLSTNTEKILKKIFTNSEFKKLASQNPDFDTLKAEILNKNRELSHSSVIKRKKSNFYSALKKYPRVQRVSFALVDDDKQYIVANQSALSRDQFKRHVLVRDDLDPTETDTIITIISPVLKDGNLKWVGIYDGKRISFNMKSEQFRKMVLNGDIHFKNGTAIDCILEIKKKIDNEGVEKIVSYNVIRVNGICEDQKTTVIIPEERSAKKKKEPANMQLDLFASLF